jgi:hypothetical protein
VVDLEYEPGSLLPPFPPERVAELEDEFTHYCGRRKRLALPASYVEHLTAFHGGVPGKKCFREPGGRVRVLGRFFNFLKEEDLSPPYTKSWRSWSLGPDIRLDYRLADFMDNEHWCIRLGYPGIHLFPIAGLDYAGHDCRGMEEFDLLCFHYGRKTEPAVVTWPWDSSWYDRKPEVVRVADTFAAFLPMLFREENHITTEEIKDF